MTEAPSPQRVASRTAATVRGLHITTMSISRSILKGGFHLGGGYFGPGVYLVPTLQDAKVYRHGQRDRATLVVEARPSSTARGKNFDDILELVGEDLREECEALMAQGEESGNALGVVARKAGFDSLYLTDPDDDDGGPQIVLFNLGSISSVGLLSQGTEEPWMLHPSTGTHRASLRTAALLQDLIKNTDPKVLQKGSGINLSVKQFSPQRGFWTYTCQGSKGEQYVVRIKGIAKGNVKQLGKAHLQVSCTCDFFRFQGPEHWAKVNKYLWGKPRGTAAAPDQKDPNKKHWICKHLAAALEHSRKFRFSSEEAMFPLGDLPLSPVSPEDTTVSQDMVVRVLSRYLESRVG